MNKPKVLLVGAVYLLLSTQLFAAETQYVAGDANPETKLCITAAVGSYTKFKRQMTDYATYSPMSTKFRFVANNIYCNGYNIAQFSEDAGNTLVANKLKKYRKHTVKIYDIAMIGGPNNGSVIIRD